jgi:hypothetical protein
MLSIPTTALVALLAAAASDAAPAGALAPLTEAQARTMMTSPTRHVRGVDLRTRRAIDEGLRRSGTFANLVLALNQSDVIVYIETSPGLPVTLSGRLLLISALEGPRYLRIQVAAQSSPVELIALLGHELQHALEVAESPGVRDEASLVALYETIGHAGKKPHQYDTLAARNAGRRVRTELVG